MCRDVISIFSCLFGTAGFLRGRRVQRHTVSEFIDSWTEKIMESNYDEDLSENAFFQELQNEHATTLERAINKGWIICVPRCGSFTRGALLEEDFLGHILIPNKELPASNFRSLTDREVKLCNRVLTVEYDIARPCSSHVLFEETFYTEDLQKYKIWCVERPLELGSTTARDSISVVTNVRECADLLWTEVLDKTVFETLNSAIDEFERANEHLENEPLYVQRDLVSALYAECLRTVLKDTRLRDKTTSSRHFLQMIKIAVETYILHGLRKILPRSVSTCTAFEDASLNKIVKNLHELQLRDLGVRTDLYDGVLRGKLELSRLDKFCTVLGKLGCLKRAVNFISEGKSSVSSDDLLPVLIFLVIRAGLPNWIAQLAFLKQFKFSANSVYEADEAGFLVTSLEAAVEHVKSGMLTGSIHPEADDISVDSNTVEDRKSNEKAEEISLNHVFDRIKYGDLSEVRRILSKKVRQLQTDVKLCHPLCSCESCERSLTDELRFDLPTVHSRDDRGLTMLHVATLSGHVKMVEYLLEHHANVNDADADGSTPLHCAAARGHQNTLLLLLHANADPTLADTRGNTALHLAADNGHEGCIKALLYFVEHTRGLLDVNFTNYNGDTPLHFASKWGYSGIVEILLEYGAKPGIKNRRGQAPLTVAHSAHISRLLEVALSKNYLSYTRKVSFEFCDVSPEMETESKVESDRLRKVEKLLSVVAEGDVQLACYYLGLEGPHKKPNETVSNLCHPLCNCEKCSLFEEVTEECERNSTLSINVCDGEGRTPLHVASANGHVEIVQLLLDAGAKVNLRIRSTGLSALHLASLNNRSKIVKMLLTCGETDPNIKDNAGNTPIHLASRTGNAKLVELLVKYGADVKIRNYQGITPLDEAEKQISLDIIKILSEDP